MLNSKDKDRRSVKETVKFVEECAEEASRFSKGWMKLLLPFGLEILQFVG